MAANGVTNGAQANGQHREKCREKPIHANRHVRVICIGAGMSGLAFSYKMRRNFTDFTLDIYDKNPDVGGTWFENRYPGCACDNPAHNYTFTFEPNPKFSANYSTAPEIFKYLSNFADKYGLRRYMHMRHEVVGATWDEARACWAVRVRGPDGAVFERECDFLINGGGILNNWRWPDLAGLDKFKGKLMHSAAWDESVDVTGKKVGLIGNGSSGIQILPQMQQRAAHVTNFIRGATWVSPTFGLEYREYSEDEKEEFAVHPQRLLAMRKHTEHLVNSVMPTNIMGSTTQVQTQAYIRQKMVEKLGDKELEEKLVPKFVFGCRRITPGIDYLESLKKPNVTVALGQIKEVTERGCVSEDGTEHPLDILVCATGFDTSFRPRFPLVGRHGRDLRDDWAAEPRSYLGIMASGYPNYFIYLGPNCPIANGTVNFAIEMQTEYMLRYVNRWQKEDIRSFDVRPEAVDDFMHQKDLFMERTVWMADCKTWYRDNKAGGKVTATWPGSMLHYMETLATPRYEDCEIKYNGRRFAYLGNGLSQTEFNPDIDGTYHIRDRDGGESMFLNPMSTFNVRRDIDPLDMLKEIETIRAGAGKSATRKADFALGGVRTGS